MAKLDIRISSDCVLRKKAGRVTVIGEAEKKLLADMAMTMRVAGGIGLAAPQVGVSKQVIIFDIGDGVVKMLNPRIASKKGSSVFEEGCLSVPGVCVKIRRPEEILLAYTAETGKKCKETFRQLAARVIQHEIDHLNGKLIIDYLPWHKKVFLKKTVKKGKNKCQL